MFIKEYEIKVPSGEFIDLVRILGRYGLRFEFSNEYIKANDNPFHPNAWRIFKIYATHKQMTMIEADMNIVSKYFLH